MSPLMNEKWTFGFISASLLLAAGLPACEEAAPEPEPKAETAQGDLASSQEKLEAAAQTGKSPDKMAAQAASTGTPSVPVTPDDPAQGNFTLEQATEGLSGEGELVAKIDTDHGELKCELYEDKAPITVANFVGLARGIRPWQNPAQEWVKVPAYDRTTFHRVIKGFMIQGGDAEGTGTGEPGYVIPDEVWPGAKHDRRGLLCMANRGPNTNGAQFFITDGPAPHLDGGFTIFGECGPDKVIQSIASVETAGDRPVEPPKIKKVTIQREG